MLESARLRSSQLLKDRKMCVCVLCVCMCVCALVMWVWTLVDTLSHIIHSGVVHAVWCVQLQILVFNVKRGRGGTFLRGFQCKYECVCWCMSVYPYIRDIFPLLFS